MAYTGLTAKLSIKKEGAADFTDVAYISNWSVEETRDVIEITKLGAKEREKFPTLYGWSASADGTADFESANGHIALREAMIGGNAIQVRFYLSATRYLEGEALIESMSVDISAEDKGNISISLSGCGMLAMQSAQVTPA